MIIAQKGHRMTQNIVRKGSKVRGLFLHGELEAGLELKEKFDVHQSAATQHAPAPG
jgi:hypothetical protein